jgi:hypothetical protein
MLIAITRRPLSDSISRIVKTVSYRIELPTFLDESVFVATYEADHQSQQNDKPRPELVHLCQDIIHSFTRFCIPLSQMT